MIYAYTLALIAGIYTGLNELNGIGLVLFIAAFALGDTCSDQIRPAPRQPAPQSRTPVAPVERYTRGGAFGYDSYSREMWLQLILKGKQTFNVQPPDWWLRSQEAEGRSIRTAASIWYKNYPPERKMMIWDQAPVEDFIARGYLR